MSQQNFKARISVKATPRQAMEAISNVSGWWAVDTKGSQSSTKRSLYRSLW